MNAPCFRLQASLAAVLAAASLATAQQPASSTAAPIPAAIAAAKTIFVSNAGADSGLFPEPFSGDPNRAYNQFYDYLKSSGKYELVGDPSQADLVVELQLTAPNGPSRGSKQLGAADPVPMFRLTIYDRKTHYVLWAMTESIDVALLQKTHDRNFDQALKTLAYDFEIVSGKMPPVAP